MKLEIKIDREEKEERIVLYTKELSKETESIYKQIERIIYKKNMYGKIDDDIYPLDTEQIIRFYSENKQIFAEDQTTRYKIDNRLYELESILPTTFIRISQSEIINTNFIKKLKMEINGFIKISFKNGMFTHSSRRYVKIIKEALQL